MKTYHISIAFLALLIFSCGNKEKIAKTEDRKEVSEATSGSTTYNADVQTSVLGWKCCKAKGCHMGTIKIKEGSISVEKDKITAGEFVVDMKTIKDKDLSDPKENKKLVDDISSDNFFDVGKFPIAKFAITSTKKLDKPDAAGNNYIIKGNLTIKDATKNIDIPSQVSITKETFSAKAKFKIDRRDFNLKYGKGKLFKGIGDDIINNEIEFNLDLKAIPAK